MNLVELYQPSNEDKLIRQFQREGFEEWALFVCQIQNFGNSFSIEESEDKERVFVQIDGPDIKHMRIGVEKDLYMKENVMDGLLTTIKRYLVTRLPL